MLAILHRQDATDGSAKYLLRLADGRMIEAVYLFEPATQSFGLCLSTQVGCGMGCVFCATARQGMERNLSASEILDQTRLLARDNPRNVTFQYVTLAGMGEPLANFDNAVSALKSLSADAEYRLAEVSLSTVGVASGLERLVADPQATFRIYLSLHAADDQLRSRLIPGSRSSQLSGRPQRAAELVDLMDQYGRKLGDRWKARISYLLLKDINDSPKHLEELTRLLEGKMVAVQLLFWNPIERAKVRIEGQLHPVARVALEVGQQWMAALNHRGIAAYTMPSYGSEVMGGCGQLSTRHRSIPLRPITVAAETPAPASL